MIYPIGHPIQWRPDIRPRQGSQRGTLARAWHRYDEFPCILWDGETTAQPEYPECVQPLEQASTRNAWAEKARTVR